MEREGKGNHLKHQSVQLISYSSFLSLHCSGDRMTFFFFFGYQARPQKTKVTEVFYVIFFLIFLTLPSGILLRPTQTYTQ